MKSNTSQIGEFDLEIKSATLFISKPTKRSVLKRVKTNLQLKRLPLTIHASWTSRLFIEQFAPADALKTPEPLARYSGEPKAVLIHGRATEAGNTNTKAAPMRNDAAILTARNSDASVYD